MLGAIGRATSELTGLKHPYNLEGDLEEGRAFGTQVNAVVALVTPFSPLYRTYNKGHSALTPFNDAPSTTQEQVKDVFCQAVKAQFGDVKEEDNHDKA